MTLTIPELSLVVLIGPSGCGKSTFARRHFTPSEVLSAGAFRSLVSDDEHDRSATDVALEALRAETARRLADARLTVIDAINVKPEARMPLVALARDHHVLPVAIVLDLPEPVCCERNQSRSDRNVGAHVIRNQRNQLHRSLGALGREGFGQVHVLSSDAEVGAVVVERKPLRNNRRQDRGPFDIIGDVHGCCDELEELLRQLGYTRSEEGFAWAHPEGRKTVFVGDLVNRGPRNADTLRTVMAMSRAGAALCAPGNHDIKLKRYLEGRDMTVSHGLDRTLAELERQTPGFSADVLTFLDGLVSHYVFDEGRLVVAHAGLKAEMQGRASARVRAFALYGETTGETDEFGLPVRYDWAAEYRGAARVVYGHTPVSEPRWRNRTINIDTGCVYGGQLTAVRWPENEIVSVPARRTYAHLARPFKAPVANP
jgi:polynucleotide kinase-phosphatase